MTKEDLVKLLEKTLYDIPDEIDGVYRVGELYSKLSGLGVERFEALRKLNERWDHEPVSGKQVYAVVMSHPDTFVKSEGRIRLMI